MVVNVIEIFFLGRFLCIKMVVRKYVFLFVRLVCGFFNFFISYFK